MDGYMIMVRRKLYLPITTEQKFSCFTSFSSLCSHKLKFVIIVSFNFYSNGASLVSFTRSKLKFTNSNEFNDVSLTII